MSGTPHLIITLSPDQTSLQAELPGAGGVRRKVAFRNADFVGDCLRILQGLARSQIEIGLDGAPTEQQVRHWERHSIFPDDRCPFCLAERKTSRQRQRSPIREHFVGDGSVTVRRLPAKRRGDGLKTSASLADLGL